ncbi:hypothetical protein ACTXT7_010745 [Hymenolepis weldensis]
MHTKRADKKPAPEEEVLKRETRDAKVAGGSENKTTSMSNPAKPNGKGILKGNGFLISGVSPCKELGLCLLDDDDSISEKEHKVEMPILFKKKPEIKKEESAQEEIKEDEDFLVDDE